MQFSNVKLILSREIRDQMRDRRTLFSVVVLPVLLYPLMGLLMTQVMQLQRTRATVVRVIGTTEIPQTVPLIIMEEVPPATPSEERPASEDEPDEEGPSANESPERDLIALRAVINPQVLAEAGLVHSRAIDLKLEVFPESPPPHEIEEMAQQAFQDGLIDAVLYFPPGFRERIEGTDASPEEVSGDQDDPLPPELYVSTRRAGSREAGIRMQQILHSWRELMIQDNLRARNIPAEVTDPFKIRRRDLTDESQQGAFLWAQIFPFILVIWALTGAFYPAVDLCAGEKERGTLETLLSSPALRGQIVAGKLLAIMVFSIATSLLNLASMALTAKLVFGQMTGGDEGLGQILGPPPIWSLGWLLLALVPMAALFSALALAIAAMARSSKEGQYYLLPLLMINLPLVLVPALPGVELSFATSLIPVTGVLLLLKALMESEYQLALAYVGPVAGVTAFCTWVSIRWAIDQFNNESVLFRESEQFSLKLWAIQIWRDRKATPTASLAIFTGLLLLLIKTFGGGFVPPPESPLGFIRYIVSIQVGMILLPVLILAWILVRDLKQTFLLKRASRESIVAAVVLALTLHPFVMLLGKRLTDTFPLPEGMTEALRDILTLAAELPLWAILLMFALLPAICEEFAFRGFILSGLRRLGHKWAAITVTALFFGILHGILHQSIAATIVGLLLGYLAVQTGSLWPPLIYHACHNSLAMLHAVVASGVQTDDWLVKYPGLRMLIAEPETGAEFLTFQPWVLGFCGIVAVLLIYWLTTLPAELSPEERRRNVLDHQDQYVPPPDQRKDLPSVEDDREETQR